MSAVTERKPRTPRQAVAVQPATVEAERPPLGHAGGRHLVVDNCGYCWPKGSAGDILDIDFDCRDYRGEGEYMVEYYDKSLEVFKNASPRFVGMRRFTKHVGSTMGLHILENTREGRAWMPVTEEFAGRIRFIGKVHDIYRKGGHGTQPGLHFVGKLSSMEEDGANTAKVTFCPEAGRTLTLSGLTNEEARRLAPLMMDAMRLELSA